MPNLVEMRWKMWLCIRNRELTDRHTHSLCFIYIRCTRYLAVSSSSQTLDTLHYPVLVPESKNWIMKPDNRTYLSFHWLLVSHSGEPTAVTKYSTVKNRVSWLLCCLPWIHTRTSQAQTWNLWLHPCSSLGVQVKLVLSANYWVLTQTV